MAHYGDCIQLLFRPEQVKKSKSGSSYERDKEKIASCQVVAFEQTQATEYWQRLMYLSPENQSPNSKQKFRERLSGKHYREDLIF